MANVFITGSADGLGKMAAQLLVAQGHQVVVHGRSLKRAEEALKSVPGAKSAVYGDLSSIAEVKQVAEQVNALGPFEAVIHNAGIGYREPKRMETPDGLPHVFAINSLAPYILTCLIERPERLIYTSSGMHKQGDFGLKDLLWEKQQWNGAQAYADTKLHNILLAFAIARKWRNVYANVVSPGWVSTKMGGSHAPDSLEEAPKTQVWLAVSEEPAVKVSGKFFYHQQAAAYLPQADDPRIQDKYIEMCQSISGIMLPA